MPCRPPMSFSSVSTCAGDISLAVDRDDVAVRDTSSSTICGSSGAFSGETVMRHIDSSGAKSGSSRMPPS